MDSLAPNNALLGITAKFDANPVKRAEAVLMRFMLQSAARKLARDHEVRHGKISQRVCTCLRRRKSHDHNVSLLYSASTRSAHLGNLQTCANVWMCAVCASKISERRLQEMTDAFDRHPELCKVLATYTLRHHLGDRLAALQSDLKAARKWMLKSGTYQRLMKRLGLVGHIRGLEPLHNEINGWHPHYHDLLLFDHELTADELAELESTLKALWLRALRQQGRDGDWANACDVRMGDKHVQEYLEKIGRLPRWTAAHELTKSQSKTTHTHGRTPNELLMLYGDGDEQAGELWLEFAAAFRGEKQLRWSDGLKELLGVEEKTDDQLMDEEREESAIFAELEWGDYCKVLANSAVGELLIVGATNDIDQVRAFLAELGATCSAPVAPPERDEQLADELEDLITRSSVVGAGTLQTAMSAKTDTGCTQSASVERTEKWSHAGPDRRRVPAPATDDVGIN